MVSCPKTTDIPKKHPAIEESGEDASIIHHIKSNTTIILAIADGVGGWRSRGIDPSNFSRSLLFHMKELKDTITDPKSLIKEAFHALIEGYRKGLEKPFGIQSIFPFRKQYLQCHFHQYQ
jgi:serine/threonine protein phosphatase PrpC